MVPSSLDIWMTVNIPLGKGLGSSASAVLSGLLIANKAYNMGLNKKELFQAAAAILRSPQKAELIFIKIGEMLLMENIIKLPEPQKDLGFPLMKALEKRKTTRKWKDAPIPEQEISNLLWAACGITKSKYGNVKSKRTDPILAAQELHIMIL